MRNHSYENDFDLHENETACISHFNMKGFALRLVLKQRRKRTRKWPIHARQFKMPRKKFMQRQWQREQIMHEEGPIVTFI